MAGRWKERMKRMAQAAQEARDRELESTSVERAIQVIEGLLASPLRPPRRKKTHPVSLSHRRKRRNGKS